MYASFEKIVNRISMLITKFNYLITLQEIAIFFSVINCIIMNVLDHKIVRILQNDDKYNIMKICLK